MANEKRLIDANALIAEYDRVHIGEAGKARKLMEDAPTVDAVEVVRCKDCINYNTDNCCDGYGWCENLGIGVHDNFFCKIGERKDGDGNG